MIGELAGDDLSTIKANVDRVHRTIARAAEKSGRRFEDIQLVAVSKTVPLSKIEMAISAGIRCFGENYAEQAAEKIRALQTPENISWHMIGHIQSRKASTVCEYFNMVHSLDRMKIARYLDRYAGEKERVMPVLIEVNLSGEASKYGWAAANESDWPDLVPQFEDICQMPNIQVRGLMSMPPFFDDPERTRPIYQKLRRFQAFLVAAIPDLDWSELSIGTTFDYAVAIEEGATMVRVGTAIFGERSK